MDKASVFRAKDAWRLPDDSLLPRFRPTVANVAARANGLFASQSVKQNLAAAALTSREFQQNALAASNGKFFPLKIVRAAPQ